MRNIFLLIAFIYSFPLFSQCELSARIKSTNIGTGARVEALQSGEFLTFDSITVLIESPYIYLRTKLDDNNNLIQKVAIAENEEDKNNVMNFRGSWLVNNSVGNTSAEYESGTFIHNNNDDAAPISINQTFIGANHGCDKIRIIESTAHGKTNIDVGSEWIDGNSNLWYIVKIVDVNNLWMLSENTGADDIWAFRSTIVSPLVHSQNGTNTSNIIFSSVTNSQMFPSVKNNSIVIKLDGINTSLDGLYRAKKVDVNNDYEIVNPASALDNLISNVGTSSPVINEGTAVVRDSIIYSFQENGACTISNKWENLQVLDLGYIGGTQALNILGDITIYMPRTLTNGGNDYNQKIPYNSNPTSVNFTNPFWSNPLLPPDRIVEESDLGFAFSHGISYLSENFYTRNGDAANAWNLFTSRKSYPRIRDNINDLPVNTIYENIVFRSYFQINQSKNYSYLNYYKVDNDYILMIDYHKLINNDIITIPESLTGELILLDKSQGLNYEICGRDIEITSTTNSEFIVLLLRN